ncbi:MAG: M23 family metallopeptidase [Ferruginibacter sp.]
MISRPTFLPIFLSAILLVSCRVSKDPMRPQLRALQKGSVTEDTSYVYSLPYDINTKHLIVQGYFSRLSHKSKAAIDIKMKKGTPILSARNGVVIRTKGNGTKGGINKKYRLDGNYIVIRHADKTQAGYWHLKKDGVLVNVGDTVNQGQLIGLSGRTGYAAFPHLHFIVWKIINGNQLQSIGTRFKTSKGIVYLRPLRRYQNSN